MHKYSLDHPNPALICNLHYFNANNIVFKDIPEAFVIILQGARALTDAQTYSQQLAALDYHIMGDIVWLVRLGSPRDFDICQRPYTHITGLPSNINKDDATFEVNVEQYIAATKSTKLFPARCLIPDTARFKNFKPVPSQGKCVSVMGHLSAVERDDNRAVKNFFIDVDNVVFLGQQGGGMPKAAESPMKLVTGAVATSLKFTGFNGSQGTVEPNPKKRKTADDRAMEEAEDKGEGTSGGRRATPRNKV